MKELNDGGPAFPRPETQYHYGAQGMSLRDWFAGQAMLGLIHQLASVENMDDAEAITFSDIAQSAYDHADAMLKAREVKP